MRHVRVGLVRAVALSGAFVVLLALTPVIRSAAAAVSPSSGPPGTEVRLPDEQFAAGDVVIKWDTDTACQGGVEVGKTTLAAPGPIGISFLVPADAPLGAHTFCAGDKPFQFTVTDTAPPAITITDGPDGGTYGPQTPLTWTFTTADGPGSGIKSVTCSIDDGTAVDCGSGTFTVSGLPDGPHKFTVAATDNAANAGAATRPFTIDATPPTSTITSAMTRVVDSPAFFEFASNEIGSTFECRDFPAGADPPAWGKCTGASSTVVKEPRGAYVVEVRAIDRYGNIELKPSQATLVVESGPQATGQGQGEVTATARPAPGKRGARKALHVRFQYRFQFSRTRTWFTSFRVAKVRRGAAISVTCRGQGCPRGTARLKSTGKAMSVRKLVGPKLGRGAVIRIRVTRRGNKAALAKLTVRRPGHIVVT